MKFEISISDLGSLAEALSKAGGRYEELGEPEAATLKAIGEAVSQALKLAESELALVASLAPYVSGDDVGLPRGEFLEFVRDRIDDDLAHAAAYRNPL